MITHTICSSTNQDFAAGGLHLGFLVSQNAQLLLACQATLSDLSLSL